LKVVQEPWLRIRRGWYTFDYLAINVLRHFSKIGHIAGVNPSQQILCADLFGFVIRREARLVNFLPAGFGLNYTRLVAPLMLRTNWNQKHVTFCRDVAYKHTDVRPAQITRRSRSGIANSYPGFQARMSHQPAIAASALRCSLTRSAISAASLNPRT